MTTEDTLTAINATIAGYHATDLLVSGDAMRWIPGEPVEGHGIHKISTSTFEGRVQVYYDCECGSRSVGVYPQTGDLTADRDRAEHYASIWHRGHSMAATGVEDADLMVVDGGLSDGEHLTYVENTTSRELEGQ